MKIAFDLEGVLADTVSAFVEFHNDEYGTDVDAEELRSSDLQECLSLEQEVYDDRVREFVRSDAYVAVEPEEDARGVIDMLDSTHSLHILTQRREGVEDGTEAWLDEYFRDVFDDIIYAGDVSKSDVCDEYGIKLFVDDTVAPVLDALEHDVTGVLYSRPWNSAADVPDRVPRVHNWSQVLQLVRNIEMFSRV